MQSEAAEAVIVAGGRGTRLAPYTTVLPKPLMPVGDRPIIDIVLSQLDQAGLERVTISIGHLGALIEAWVTNGPDYKTPIEFLYEDEPLGTAGALGNLKPRCDTILATNGDILTTLKAGELLAHHRKSGSIATVATNIREVPIEYGVITTEPADGLSKIVGLDEKPTHRFEVSMGIYAFDRSALKYIKPGEKIDFPDLLQRLIDDDRQVITYQFEGYWRDIGNTADYGQATEDFDADQSRFLPS